MSKQYYNTESIQSIQHRAQKTATPLTRQTESNDCEAPSECFSPKSRSYQRSYQQQPQQQQQAFSAQPNPCAPQKPPPTVDVPNNFPVLGGYAQSSITKNDNEQGEKFDLGMDGAFSDFSVLVMAFISFLDNDWVTCAGAALKKKGFRLKYCAYTEVKTFLKEIETGGYDVVWILSSGGGYIDGWSPDSAKTFLKDTEKEAFLKAINDFHKSGRGLMVWADNEPYYYEANLVLSNIADTTLKGNTYGNNVLSYGKSETPGEFDENHIIFAGVNYLYEGVTICYPENLGKLKTLATSSNGKPVILNMESDENHGRVIVDSGWTKLYTSYWSSVGQARYVVNACAWLVDVERRFGAEPPKTYSTNRENVEKQEKVNTTVGVGDVTTVNPVRLDTMDVTQLMTEEIVHEDKVQEEQSTCDVQ